MGEESDGNLTVCKQRLLRKAQVYQDISQYKWGLIMYRNVISLWTCLDLENLFSGWEALDPKRIILYFNRVKHSVIYQRFPYTSDVSDGLLHPFDHGAFRGNSCNSCLSSLRWDERRTPMFWFKLVLAKAREKESCGFRWQMRWISSLVGDKNTKEWKNHGWVL